MTIVKIRIEADLVDKYAFTEVAKPEGNTNSAKKAIAEYEMKQRRR